MQAPPSAPNAPVNVNVHTAPIVITTSQGHGLFVRFIWFCVLGWWLGPLTATLGWLLTASVVLMPLGLGLIARVPTAVSLRPRVQRFTSDYRDGVMHLRSGYTEQRSWLIRLPYLLCIGLWVGLPWILFACIFTLPIINLVAFPLAIAMFDRTAAVMTLHRN